MTNPDQDDDLLDEREFDLDELELKEFGAVGDAPRDFEALRARRAKMEKERAVRQQMTDVVELLENITMSGDDPDEKMRLMKEVARQFSTDSTEQPAQEIQPGAVMSKEQAPGPFSGLVDAIVTAVGNLVAKEAFKAEGGERYSASDFAYVPDPEKPATWKFRMAERPGDVTVKQLGRVADELEAPGDLPGEDVAKVKSLVRSEYRRLGAEIPPHVRSHTTFDIVETKEDGSGRIVVTFSNNFIDNDLPREILSRESHIRFVEAVEKGLAQNPELWLWHVPEWSIGEADGVVLDDQGDVVFVVATGRIYPEAMPLVKEFCEKFTPAASHGMYRELIERDPNDKSVITRYTTHEISLLPDWAAANPFTIFSLSDALIKENTMAISPEKRMKLLATGLSQEALEAVEQMNAAQASRAKSRGVLHKEATTEATAETTDEAPQAATEDAATPEAATATEAAPELKSTDPVPTVTEIAEAIEGEVTRQVSALAGVVSELATEVAALRKELSTKEAQPEKTTLAAAMSARRRAISADETEVTEAAVKESGPRVAAPSTDGQTPIRGFIDVLHSKGLDNYVKDLGANQS